MYPDDDERIPSGGSVFDREAVYKEEGVFVEPPEPEEGCDPDEERCAPDEYAEDPFSENTGPGTADDLPYGYGVSTSRPADAHLVADDAPAFEAGHAGESAAKDDAPFAAADEADLWRRQMPLIEEDEDDGLKLEGFEEERIPDILDAMGDDAAEALSEAPNGVSATGSPFEPEHGGFPERE